MPVPAWRRSGRIRKKKLLQSSLLLSSVNVDFNSRRRQAILWSQESNPCSWKYWNMPSPLCVNLLTANYFQTIVSSYQSCTDEEFYWYWLIANLWHTCVHAWRMHMRTRAHTHAHTYTHTRMHTHLHTHAPTHAHTHTHHTHTFITEALHLITNVQPLK